MKGRNLFFIALLVLIAGVVLVCLQHSVSANGVVLTCGVLFILAGLFNITVFMSSGHDSKSGKGPFSAAISWVSSAAAVILGLCMLIFQGTFATLVAFMFGVLIAFGALFQFYLLGYGSRPARLPGWLYIVPTALAAVAIYLFIQRDEAVPDDLAILLTGISLIVFGGATLVEAVIIGRYNRSVLKGKKPEEEKPEEKSDKTVKPLDSSTDAGKATSTSQETASSDDQKSI